MIKQGEVYLVNLEPTVGQEIKKTRPVVVISNNSINKYGRVIVVVPITSNIKKISPSHVLIPQKISGLDKESKTVTEHIKSIDRQRLIKRLGKLPHEYISMVLQALRNTCGM